MDYPSDQGRLNKVINWLGRNMGRLLAAIFVPTITFIVLWQVFIFLRDNQASQWLTAIIAIIWGVGGVAALYYIANWLVEMLPVGARRNLTPFIFVGPALAILSIYLLWPVFRTLWLSFLDGDSEKIVWFANYKYVFTNSTMRRAFFNNLLWLVLETGLCVGLGLLIAVLADRTATWFETFIKSLIFMPMAISMVGASIIWLFVYHYRPEGEMQIGLLNALLTAFNVAPYNWLFYKPWNNIFLIIVGVWMQTGYAMVILSAAIKGIPAELIEAGRIDGASEFQIFSRIMVPYISGTIVTVSTTIILWTLKIFDIVLTMGGSGTEVIATEFYSQMFQSFHYGRGSAIAIVLLIAVIPVMWYNLRQFSQQTEAF